ncbi:MAG: hypothetical protein F4Z75_03340 [Synechococcus sp. SB0668_bin_15]|nr:hypothetical protein [Synechococcus sp. SB0668_bin_15]MXZ82426.1 hypothetical protein [Synechococcus sp. SB0666_bin_14]MYC49615.1 hypothetical protein [Synechococcus sp. SB0662_bin_14]MYJ58896.1 hypothetical protein [Synechococcus sp. SB0672_bin_6]
MGWDPGIMRKFATTSHQRLIHQLRGELRKDNKDDLAPRLPTTAPDSDRDASAASRGNTSSQRRSQEKQRSRSFRQRLNAVDMR